jgi:thioredoxin 1
MSVAVHANDPEAFATEVLSSAVPVVVDFWAEWCGPCRMVSPELEALASEYGSAVKVVKVDVDANPTVAAHYRIQGIPTIGLFEAGEMTGQVVGARPKAAIATELGLGRFAPASKGA